jgi:hypothetical protein
MLKIYTSSQIAEKSGYKVLSNIDEFFKIKSKDMRNMYKNSISVRVLKEVEGMTSRIGDIIDGKFGTVRLQDISTGGKGCLLAVNFQDFIIDTCQLGDNCLLLLMDLADKMDITIMHSEPIFLFGNRTVNVDNTEYTGFAATEAMLDAEDLEVEYV